MLVITRKEGEKIFLGDDIQLTVVRINGNTVRLGIEAEPGITVLRGEIVARISEDTQDATTKPTVQET